jgi:O-methyltransferase
MSLSRYYARLLRESARSVAKGIGLPFVRREAVRSGRHALPYPLATYAPWQVDPDFQAVWQTVRANTLVDELRCWELWTLVGELRDVPGAMLEVGVWRGGTGGLMAARAAALGIEDPIYLCDTWEGVVKAGPADPYYRGREHEDSSMEMVRTLLGRLGVERVELLQGVFPEDTGASVSAEALRLVHIDVDVYESAADSFNWAWPRVSTGGVVVFDDYGWPATPGVARFVDEQRGKPDRLVLHNLNGHGLIVKR